MFSIASLTSEEYSSLNSIELKSALYVGIADAKRLFLVSMHFIVNYPQAKDLWASDFSEECPFKRLGLISSPSV